MERTLIFLFLAFTQVSYAQTTISNLKTLGDKKLTKLIYREILKKQISISQGLLDRDVPETKGFINIRRKFIGDLPDGRRAFYLTRALDFTEFEVAKEELEDTLTLVFQWLAKQPKGVVLVLDSPGGLVTIMNDFFAALKLVEEKTTITAILPSYGSCASACSGIFLYVEHRECNPISMIGLHGVSRNGSLVEQSTNEFIENLVSMPSSHAPREWILQRKDEGAFSSLQLSWYSCEELSKAGLIKKVLPVTESTNRSVPPIEMLDFATSQFDGAAAKTAAFTPDIIDQLEGIFRNKFRILYHDKLLMINQLRGDEQ
jgi:hypothetical protein